MRTVLEIGGGMTPYFVRYTIPWNPEYEYVCVDVTEKNVEEARLAVEKVRQRGGSYPSKSRFLLQDAVSLPFQDASVHEIVLSNVLSAPIHFNWNDKGTEVTLKNPSGAITRPIMGSPADRDLFYRERKPLIDEAVRVLKPGGTLSIYTDLIVYGIHSYARIIEELGNHPGFMYRVDDEEARRIDENNKLKMTSGDFCYCFNAEVLPESSVFRFIKK